jgi:FtsH-binding integral membrane protein
MTRYQNDVPRYDNETSGWGVSVADASVETRADFIRKTYVHLVGAVLAFVGIECALFALVPDSTQLAIMQFLGQSPYMWLLVLAGFMGVSYIADRFAHSPASRPLQYSGLALYVVAEAFLFLPLIWIAANFSPPGTIGAAALVTAIIFASLTAFVFITRTDFSWMRGILFIAGGAALAVIAAGILFNFDMGLWLVVPMIALACGYILYQTSAMIHHYQPGQHVAASLALFASVALLFWWILRLIMSLQRD